MQLCRCLILCFERWKMLSLCFVVAADDTAHSDEATNRAIWMESSFLADHTALKLQSSQHVWGCQTLCSGTHCLQLHTFSAVAEKIRAKLVELKKAHPDDNTGVTTCFQTMQKYLANVYRDPSQEKFRNIRVGNPAFQQRVGAFTGSLDILELCGFKVSSLRLKLFLLIAPQNTP